MKSGNRMGSRMKKIGVLLRSASTKEMERIDRHESTRFELLKPAAAPCTPRMQCECFGFEMSQSNPAS